MAKQPQSAPAPSFEDGVSYEVKISKPINIGGSLVVRPSDSRIVLDGALCKLHSDDIISAVRLG